MKNIIIKIGLAFLSVFIAFFLAEILLRAFWHPIKLDPKYRRDDLKWLQENVILNRYNYRDHDFSLKKPGGVFRVYSLGDSFTFGWYINDASLAYPKVLEKKLQEEYGKERIEIINAARHGFSFAESLARLKNEGILFNPDLVTIGITAYDLVNINSPKPLVANKFLRSLYLYKISLGKIEEIRIAKTTKKTFEITFEETSGGMEAIKKLFQEYKQTTDLMGAKAVVIIFPEYNSFDPNGPYQLEVYHSKMNKMAQEAGLEVVDLVESFSKYSDKRNLILNPNDPHPSILANDMAADFIYRKVDFKNLMENTQPLLPTSQLMGTPKVLLPSYGGVLSLDAGWMYFDDFSSGVKTIPLPNDSNRKIAYLDHYFETIKTFTGDGWPGAKLTYYLPYEGAKTTLHRELFGYSVVGVSRITAFWREEGALRSKDLDLKEAKVSRDEKNIYLQTNLNKKPDHFKLQLDIAVKQINIEDNKILNLAETKLITSTISKGQTRMLLKSENAFGSLPRFFIDGQNIDYAWINDELLFVKYDKEKNAFWMELENAVSKDVFVEVPVAVDISHNLAEFPMIEYIKKKEIL